MFSLKFAKRYQNQIYTNYNIEFPEEDYYNLYNNIFCIADGVTRDLKKGEVVPYPKTKEQAEYIANNYPNPSGALMSSKISADNFIEYIKQYEETQINEEVVLNAVKKLNKDIWEINKGREIDYLEEDLYCSEAVGGIILDNYLYCFSIGDCYVKCYNSEYEEVFVTENDHLLMEKYEDEFLKSGEYNWFDPRYRILIRAGLRNNSIITYNNKRVGYGALTGEDSAIDFVKIYKINLEDVKYICAYSDGCMPYFEGSVAKKTIENPEIIAKEGSERTVIIYEKNI